MNVIQRHLEYLKENPEGYWFKRKLYGWGWTPATWQGWVVILLFILFLIWTGARLGETPSERDLILFFAKMIVSVAVVIFICFKTGEKPKWQWGLPKEKIITDKQK